MSRAKNRARRQFLKSMSAGFPAAVLLGANTGAAFADETSAPTSSSHKEPEPGPMIDLGSEVAGDDAITFRRHTLDLGCCETVTVADINLDGRLDIVSGENWYEQAPPQAGWVPASSSTSFAISGTRTITSRI